MFRILVLGIGSAVAVLLGTIPAEGFLDLALVGVAAGVSGATALAARERRRIDSLPLVLAVRGVRGVWAGRDVAGFRVWLGRGRVVRSPDVEATFKPVDGDEISLQATLPGDLFCGPWTLYVPDPGVPGHFQIRVDVKEGGRQWQVSGEWHRDALTPGRFSSPVARVGGRLVWIPDRWDQVDETDNET